MSVWKRLSNIFTQKNTDLRLLQKEIDTNKIYSLLKLRKSYLENNGERNETEEKDEDFVRNAVESELKSQFQNLAQSLQEILQPSLKRTLDLNINAVSTSKEKRFRGSGLSYAVAKSTKQTETSSPFPIPLVLSQAELNGKIHEKMGFSLEVGDSKVDHPEAGEGLFLRGKAQMGSVVGIYPGVVYPPFYLPKIPDYPRIDVNNPYLISRFDGTVIDARPWGIGSETMEIWSGLEAKDVEWFWSSKSSKRNNTTKAPHLDDIETTAMWIERRNTFALAHFANHPPRGVLPNVMVYAHDVVVSPEMSSIRPYIPNVHFRWRDGVAQEVERRGLLWVREGNQREIERKIGGNVVKTLLIVTLRDVEDEELFLNYRLSNPFGRPSWYHPVDPEEDKRRWAI